MNLEDLSRNNTLETEHQHEAGMVEISELEEPIKRIIGKIRDKIERGDYGIIIGDDASGRVPALILGGFIKKIAEHKKLLAPKTIFIPGGLNQSTDFTEKLKNHMIKYGFTAGKKVLIVTEAIESGSSLSKLVATLQSLKIDFDLTTIGVELSKDLGYQEKRRKNLGENIVSGEYARTAGVVIRPTPLIYNRKITTGVYKYKGDLQSKTVKSANFLGNTLPEEKDLVQKNINQSRKEINILIDKLVSWYLSH